MWRSAFSSISRHSSQRSEVGLLVCRSMTTRGYCLQFVIQCHLSGSAPFTYSSKHKPSTVIYYAPNICNLRKYKSGKFSRGKNDAVKCIKSSLDSQCFACLFSKRKKQAEKYCLTLLCQPSQRKHHYNISIQHQTQCIFSCKQGTSYPNQLHLTYVSQMVI